MKYKGKFIFKKQWYSICSMHYEYKEDCNCCNTGTWENIFIHKIGSFIYKKFPKFWIWWMNLKPIKFKTLKK
jgi:hypothetical protein